MKKLLLVFSVVLALSAAGFSACNTDAGNGGDAPHVHHFTEEVTKQATCTEEGEIKYTCTICGESFTETVEKTGHTWNDGEITKEATCEESGTLTITCTVCGKTEEQEIPLSQHTWNEGEITVQPTCISDGEQIYTCAVCGKTRKDTLTRSEQYCVMGEGFFDGGGSHYKYCSVCKRNMGEEVVHTENAYCEQCGRGLIYQLNDQGEYSIIGVQSGVTVTTLKLPDTYCGIPVSEIGEGAFQNNKTITICAFGKNLKTIGKSAFSGCTNLMSLSLGNVTSIGSSAFSGCTNLTSLAIPEQVQTIGDSAFA